MKLNKYLKVKLSSFTQNGGINKKLAKIISSDLFWILIIGGIARILYYSLLKDKISIDGNSYLYDYSNILKGKINSYRTPVYPYFIKLIRLFGEKKLIRNIIDVQSIISFFTIIFFYKTTKIKLKNRSVIITATLFYAMMLPVINFDTMIYTESLSVSFMVTFIWLVASYLNKQTIIKASIITVATFFATILRPSFIFLVPIVILFWCFRLIILKKDKRMCLWGLASSVLVVLLLHGYCSLNKKNVGFYGISTVSNVNQLDIIIIGNMFMKGNDVELSNVIKNHFNNPLTIEQHGVYLREIIQKYEPKRISNFISNCIKNQPQIFIKRILRTCAKLQTNDIFTFYAQKKEGILPRLVIDAQFFIFYTTFNKIFIFLAFDFIFIVVTWFRSKQPPWLSLVLWLVIVAQIAVAIIGAQAEYQRLILAAIPCLIISFFSYVDRISNAIDTTKLKNYPPAI